MPVERRRILDEQAVDAAEFARKTGNVVVAAEMAAIGLGLTSSPLTCEEVAVLSEDPRARAVLACLARIHVDSLKTIANQACWPHHSLLVLEKAARTVKVVYRQPDFER